ncbi:MAG TPA: C4-type zinc ribbon domain-containing protein [Verrucomicrobiae bacterium]
MLEAIEKLLILQDRDRHIRRVESELGRIGPEREALRARTGAAQTALESARLRVKQLESERKQLEMEVEGKKQLIERYANQQLQTRKNEEYRALAHEIEECKESIRQIEDRELELMEQGEAALKEVARATEEAKKAKEFTDGQIAALDAREASLTAEREQLKTNREELAAAVEAAARSRYERLIKTRGDNIVVGIEHGVCGGCHMRLPAQIIVTCRAEQELVTCTNCGRILYHTRDMDMAVAE